MDRNETKMIQGLSVLAMVCLHLFDRHDFQGLYTPLLFIKDIPLSFYFGQLSDFCVMGFAFCSGYGHLKSFGSPNYYKKSLIRLLLLYINFWIILFAFSIVSIAVGQGSFMPANAITFIKTVFTISPAYNGAWWYLPVYAVLVFLSPIILKASKKLNTIYLVLITVIVYCFSYMLRFRWTTGIEAVDWFGPFGTTFAEYMIGVVCCKENIIEKIKKQCGKISNWFLYPLFAVVFIGMLLARTLIIPTLAVAPITGFVIICIFCVIKKPKFVEKFFLYIGSHSTDIWLIHMFFYLVLFKNFVYKAQYPLLIFAFMIIICLACSYIIRFIHNPIKNKIQKLSEK